MKKTLRLILGDQLNEEHSWFKDKSDKVIYCLFEMRQETDYVQHHIQKVLGFFAAMRNFGKKIENEGNNIIYYKINDEKNAQDLAQNLKLIIEENSIEHFEYQLPDEYRLDEQLREFCKEISISSKVYDTEHFLTERDDVANFFDGKKTWTMEYFYREMRRKYDILMENGKPYSGKWNYDEENRKKIPKNHVPPQPFLMGKDLSELLKEIEKAGVKTIGKVDAKNYIWPTSRKESLDLLTFFVKKCLVHFGTFQDAMTPEFWSLYHSRLSFSLNTKMLHPLEVVNEVISYWSDNQEEIKFHQTEGFVRQIVGWREYMRGIYWTKMPKYATENFFENKRPLPEMYWTGDTKMACLKHSINQSLNYAYAHHIQRLMITGNFALLAGCHPDEVDKWYLGIYIDAIEWVEITNTRGMSQFADGGLVATKPYISSANYVNKMSNYCKNCYYSPKIKTGEKACPFNSLYWNFLDRNQKKLKNNPRMGMMYRNWEKQNPEQKEKILKQAATYLEKINEL